LALFLILLSQRRLFFEKPGQIARCLSELVKNLTPSQMKRNKEEVPGFDEIIFKDRNKEYGAYKIRKGYNTTLGYSLLCGVALAVILVVLPALTSPRASAEPPREIVVAAPTPDLEKMLQAEKPPERKVPDEIVPINASAPPVIVSDTSEVTDNNLITDFDNAINGDVTENPPEEFDSDPIIPEEPQKRWVTVQEMPEFPGGEVALLQFVADNIVYPSEALENTVEGKIIIRFVVAPTGYVEEIEVLKSTGTATDLTLLENEAKRVINILPRWRPGKQDGIAVPVYYTVPVIFRINH
jgi:periplasmic protein TonB